jgi:hypothetical protein
MSPAHAPGTNVEDLVIVMNAIWGPLSHEDVQIPKLPFLRQVYTAVTPLTVGVYTTDGFFDPAPACVRAVTEAEAILRSNPLVKVVPFNPPRMADVSRSTPTAVLLH